MNKWRAIQAALSPDQSEEADRLPETRARFAWRKSPFARERCEVAEAVIEEARPEPGVTVEHEQMASEESGEGRVELEVCREEEQVGRTRDVPVVARPRKKTSRKKQKG
ncbi:MAG: hypothetical protein ABMA26_22670 [Limisphaerales bacterium]